MIATRARATRSCRFCKAGTSHYHCSSCQIVQDYPGYCEACQAELEGRTVYTSDPEIWLQLVQEIFQPSLPR